MTLPVEYAEHATRLLIGQLAILANVTMLQGFAFIPEVDGAYWTLTVEIAFYVCMAAIWTCGGTRRLEPVLVPSPQTARPLRMAWRQRPAPRGRRGS